MTCVIRKGVDLSHRACRQTQIGHQRYQSHLPTLCYRWAIPIHMRCGAPASSTLPMTHQHVLRESEFGRTRKRHIQLDWGRRLRLVFGNSDGHGVPRQGSTPRLFRHAVVAEVCCRGALRWGLEGHYRKRGGDAEETLHVWGARGIAILQGLLLVRSSVSFMYVGWEGAEPEPRTPGSVRGDLGKIPWPWT